MRIPIILFLLAFSASAIFAQNKRSVSKFKPPKDILKTKKLKKAPTHRDIFDNCMRQTPPLSITVGVLTYGKSFLGNPYPKANADTSRPVQSGAVVLQAISKEVLVINLKSFDCVTFVENMIALSQTRLSQKPDFDTFKQFLTHVRYRNGVIDYAARLHYFSDWLFENEKRGIMRQITKNLGGEVFNKPVYYMSLKRDTLYGNMADSATYQAVKQVEAAITKREKWYIPKERVSTIEKDLKEGDIIGITNRLDGMDMAHVGIVVWQNGRAHLLHASSQLHKVVITDVPLVDYLLRNKSQTGIMVARLEKSLPIFPAKT
jgi:hypothetical protein